MQGELPSIMTGFLDVEESSLFLPQNLAFMPSAKQCSGTSSSYKSFLFPALIE
jgi:hypothetical protein